MPTIVLARAAKACVDLKLRPGPSLVAFATANQAVGHRANMTPAQAREVLGMEPARVRPRRVVRDA